MKKITKYWKKLKIRTQIILVYILILILSFALTFTFVSMVNNKYTKMEVGKAGEQTVSAVQGNLSLVFENVIQLSTYIYFYDIVQGSLKKINSKNIEIEYQKNITKSLFNMILSGDYISGVYIFDKYDNCYNSYRKTPRKIDKNIRKTNWYRKMEKANGNGFFYKGSDGTIDYYQNNNYLCYVRQIVDKNNYKPVATLLITLDPNVLQGYFNQVSDDKNQFYIVDSKGEYVVEPENKQENFVKYTKDTKRMSQGFEEVKTSKGKCIAVGHSMGIQDWKIIGTFSLDEISSLTPYYSTVIIIIMCLNIIFVFLCSTLLTYLIFKPIGKIEEHMKLIENGKFITMESDEYENEITNLRQVFNHMILSIKKLMNKVKEEEGIIAKGKLDIIYAQINPHFLYNTLDAVSALALMEENEKCFEITQALGNFYRNSLNSGLDYITVEDEIDSIKSYITILNMRYDNQIKVDYQIEESVKKEKILKLLLQPLVENAVHHGLNGEEGTVSIKAFSQDDEIIFIVSDDGVGMSEDRVEAILHGKNITGKSGFGLHSLIQRIRLLYEIENPIIIQSEIGNGTEIIVTVKKMKGENYIC